MLHVILIGVLVLFSAACASPLHKAARSGDVRAVRALLAGRTDLESRKNGQAPLHYAVLRSRYEVVRVLLQNGADINAQANGHCSALHFAVVRGDAEMVRLLLENGANPEPGSAVGCGMPGAVSSMTPLEMAKARGNEAMAAMLGAASRSKLGLAEGSIRNADEYGPLVTALLRNYADGNKAIAVAGFSYSDGRVSSDGEVVSDRFTTELVKRRGFRVVERKQIEKVLAEVKFQNTGVLDQESAKRIGRMLGADFLVVGGLAELPGKGIEVNMRLVAVESGEAVAAAAGRVGKDWIVTGP